MASPSDNVSMAVFCDFENVALGVRDAKYEKFDIKPVLERLLLKGSIVVKKAYCDWDRYKGFKATMHESNFELIEIPHVRQSGKNSADIRLVVDALDLCYTKSHVNTFVIISGDSDFSPLVSKLRENAKQVIGVGVKQSTSDLLVANCDEFIFYDDLVRESRRTAAKRDARDGREVQPVAKRPTDEGNRRKEELELRKTQAIDMAVETFDAMMSERGDSGKIWASVLKQAIKRRKPDFSESYYGFRTFGNLIEEAQARGLLEFGRDEKSGAYVYRSSAMGMSKEVAIEPQAIIEPAPETAVAAEAMPETDAKHEPRRRSRGTRKPAARKDAGDLATADTRELAVDNMPAPDGFLPPADAQGAASSQPQHERSAAQPQHTHESSHERTDRSADESNHESIHESSHELRHAAPSDGMATPDTQPQADVDAKRAPRKTAARKPAVRRPRARKQAAEPETS